ncbi:MAG TPA: type II toxin-antitoxin system prevent-host-death family antitoxin [Acidobacteriota bacterium]|nr:type II toxin-antitoxin system prevent-host-death family antitoxin [Acidobacteriota bacterium]
MRHPDEETVGIRELRQYLSRYLERVSRGETLRVTDRGREVAILAPLPEESSVVDRLERDGRLASRASADLVNLGPPAAHPISMSISEALREQRSDG